MKKYNGYKTYDVFLQSGMFMIIRWVFSYCYTAATCSAVCTKWKSRCFQDSFFLMALFFFWLSDLKIERTKMKLSSRYLKIQLGQNLIYKGGK